MVDRKVYGEAFICLMDLMHYFLGPLVPARTIARDPSGCFPLFTTLVEFYVKIGELGD